MKPDDPPPGAPASPEAPPPASLTNVRLRSRAQPDTAAKPPVKRGDLTQQLQAADLPETPPADPQRTTPKRGDLTQQLEAAARKTPAPAVPPPPAPPPKAKAEPPLERKPAKAEPAPAPQPKIEPAREAKAAPAPKMEPPPERKPAAAPPPERKAAAAKAEPPPRAPQPAVEPMPERKPAAAKAESAPLGQDEVDALFESLPPPPAPEPPVEAKPAAAKAAKPPVQPAPIEAAAKPEAAPPADDTHADIQAGSVLAEKDVRALLDPPGRRPAAPPPVAEPIAEPEELIASEPAPEEELPPPAETPELRLVVDEPEEAAEPAPLAAAPEAAPAAAGSIDQIIDYWDGLRGERAYPILDTVDRSHISRSWPNCLLVAFTSMTGTDAVQPRMTRIGEANGQVEYTAMVIDWIIRCGRQSVKRGEPMEEEKRFPVTGGNARYQLLLLPLSSTEGKADYVLAHLCKVKELSAGAAFKRWLAS
jgi:hypothetical protein